MLSPVTARPGGRPAPTLESVAALAGVSRATAGRVVVRQPVVAMGAAMAARLMTVIGEGPGDPAPVIMPTELVLRDTA